MLLRAAWVVPVTSPPIRDGFVQIEAGRIVDVGPWSAAPAARPGALIDLGDALLTPGLVNPHTHLELTDYAGQLPPAPFWDWIAGLVRLRAAPGQLDREQGGVRHGAELLLRAGVTCVGDISRLNLAWPILKASPLRKVCFTELLTLADHPPRDLDELRRALDEVDEDERLTAGISPHAPWSVPALQIRAAIDLALEHGRPWSMHFAETPEELDFLRGAGGLPAFVADLARRAGVESPRCGPGDFLEACAPGGGAGSLAHGNYLAPADLGALAAAGHTVIYCPRAHRFFGHAPHPLAALRRAGVSVALGTDSLASNEGLSPLEEARFVLEHVRGAPSPDDLLAMITIHAAAALGLGGRVGALEAGRLADLACFAGPFDDQDPVGDLLRRAPLASRVWIGGAETGPPRGGTRV